MRFHDFLWIDSDFLRFFGYVIVPMEKNTLYKYMCYELSMHNKHEFHLIAQLWMVHTTAEYRLLILLKKL